MKYILLLFIVCFSLNAQTPASSMTIGGVDYEFVGDSFSSYRLSDYSDINPDDPLSYIHAFVRDAIVNEQDLNLGGNSRETITFTGLSRQRHTLNRNTITFVDQATFYAGNTVYATSYQSTCPGYILTINRGVWNDDLTDFEKRRLMYHEFGHALLNKEHVCESTATYSSALSKLVNHEAMMLGGDCDEINRIGLVCPEDRLVNPDIIERVYGGTCSNEVDFSRWDDLLSHFYARHIPLRGGVCGTSSKGQSSIIHD